MSTKQQYVIAHRIAKAIVCAIICVLSLLHNHMHLSTLLILINILFFFGVNTVAYLIESVMHWKHKHEKL